MIIYSYRCLKCGHEWTDKAKHNDLPKNFPKKCPYCRSEKWNELSKIVSEPVGRKPKAKKEVA
jgi:putative FmdB family regulatory protein